jgi:hypothetical protein
MVPALRKFVLTIHLTSSIGWIGAAIAYLVLGISAVTSQDAEIVRATWIAMEITGWFAIVPLAIASMVTGLVMSLGTQWGLFRHYWVVITLVLTVICVLVLVSHMPTVSHLAGIVREGSASSAEAHEGDLFHAGGGLVVLLVITVLNVYKPRGLTPYGWRKQQEQRKRPQP